MWQAIAEHINSELDIDFKVESKHQLSGGDINLAYHISDDKHDFFIKLNEKEQLEQFISEAMCLHCIEQRHAIRVPKVICYGQTLDKAFLVLEYIPLVDEHNAGWEALGLAMAKLHEDSGQAMYGFDWDCTLGRTSQPNKWQGNWSSFFSEQRLGWLLQLLQEQGFGFGKIDFLVEQCRQRLHHYEPVPSLVHGDFWRGNVGFTADEAIIFDPSSYYGDREVDIAFSELFGRFPERFYHSYQSQYPLDKNYTERKSLYNLYHVLNHAYMFRGSYLLQAQDMVKHLFY
ncbi:fructosamine kinase family protein [Alkalimonas amylolytica]|uniref:Fructosamine-3-kinase n=1 Tax=Alkalimonas amylolytica TaxID=152573 RepID=A0A1H3ZEX1_ALKAM|nr:fructosamine kinase family protein [Alkalimonas amylolytica]SEA22058.1 Fructosamine-3-kinase [Alkalimonas amylolytica]